MSVRVSKPEFNLREKLSELDKPTGIKGSELLKSNTIQEARDLIGAGRKNLIINGNFDVWQRGTTFSSFNSMRYTADRWLQYAAGSSTITATQQPFTVGQTEVPGNPKYYYRLDNTPDPNTAWLELFYRIEDVRRFSSVPVTISFWLRANKPQIGEDEIRLLQNFGTSGSAAVTVRGPLFDIQTYWQKYEFTFDLPSVAGKTINADSFLQIHLLRATNAVGADTYYDLAQVQLEYGRVATPFEQRSFGEELELCQRYFQSNFPTGVAPQNGYYNSNTGLAAGFNGVVCFATNQLRSPHIMFNPKMRVEPDVTIYAASSDDDDGRWAAYNGSWSSNSANTVDKFGNTGFGVRYPSGGISATAGNAYLYRGMWTADAELPATYSP